MRFVRLSDSDIKLGTIQYQFTCQPVILDKILQLNIVILPILVGKSDLCCYKGPRTSRRSFWESQTLCFFYNMITKCSNMRDQNHSIFKYQMSVKLLITIRNNKECTNVQILERNNICNFVTFIITRQINITPVLV